MKLRASALLAVVSGACAIACGPRGMPPRTPVADAVSSFVVWTEVAIGPERSLAGRSIGVLPLHGGEIVRLVLVHEAVRTFEVGERLGRAADAVEAWSMHEASRGEVVLRAEAAASALIFDRAEVSRAYLGHGSDPGYHFFALEDRVLQWARGPLPARFPAVAPEERIDFEGFAVLDRALARAVGEARDTEAAREQASALRGVAGLRALRALRPAVGYPYFFDSVPRPRSGAEPDAMGRYALPRGGALEIAVEGPALLHLFTTALSFATDESLRVRVLESGRERALTFASPPRPMPSGARSSQSRSLGLRRAVVHVPPGLHLYRVEAMGGDARARFLLAVPVVHLDDALRGDKDETRQLALATRACARPESAALCAFARALQGADTPAARLPSGELSFGDAMAASTEDVRVLAEVLARGGPRDPTITLEWDASHGDAVALETLRFRVAHGVDDVTDRAWVRARARGTRLMPVGASSPDEASEWTGIAFSAALRSQDIDATRCEALVRAGALPELGARPTEVASRSWRGTHAIEIVAAVSCDEAAPVEIEVDGERLTAQPSAPLARWHVRVRGERATVRRVDGGGGRLYALTAETAACGARLHAAQLARVGAQPVRLDFDGSAEPELELWLREGAAGAELKLEPARVGSPDAALGLRLVVPRTQGATMLDPLGARFIRAARIPLPAWANSGITVSSTSEVAVRALRLQPTAPATLAEPSSPRAPPSAEPLDEAGLIELTRRLLAAAPEARGRLYFERALFFARAGAERAAWRDAEAARQLAPASGAEMLERVRAELRARPGRVTPLPEAVVAYGVEPDFDPSSRRCSLDGDGPRARLARILAELGARDRKLETARSYEAAQAAAGLDAAQHAAFDPRSDRVTLHALQGGRWKTLTDLAPEPKRLPADDAARSRSPLDARGELRPSAAAGRPFADGTYATVTAERPASARVGGAGLALHGRLELVCVARAAAATAAGCPVRVAGVGEGAIAPPFDRDGRASVAFGASARRAARLEVAFERAAPDFALLVRIVVDRAIAGSREEPGVGFVLVPSPRLSRYLVSPRAPLRIALTGPSVLRLDARALGSQAVRVVARMGDATRDLPVDGSPLLWPALQPGEVVIEALEGEASVEIAERVARDTREELEPEAPAWGGEPQVATAPDAAKSEPAAGTAAESQRTTWRDLALRSPEPLTPLEASLGTVALALGAVQGTMREGFPRNAAPDTYAFGILDYRRRIEAIGLWTSSELFARARDGEPTFGGAIGGYEELADLHLRLSAELGMAAQRIAGTLVQTWKPHGFVEYSWRVTRNFFILPRLGYDGVYAPLIAIPRDLTLIDDGVYNAYRAKHPTFLFAQALFWFVPHFNDIFYLRSRMSFDPFDRAMDHFTARPGLFAVFGTLDLSVFGEGTYRRPTPGLARAGTFEQGVGVVATYDLWSGFGSLVIEPGAAAFARTRDGAWQVNVFVNLLSSFRRGLRDYSSLTLDFPEQLSGGIPWRGNLPGGYR